jgi:cytidine deaminase
VGAAILGADGTIYRGTCIEVSSGQGSCAERSAATAMVSAGCTQVELLVAVSYDGAVLAPCGQCREFVLELDRANGDALVVVSRGHVARLGDLLPHSFEGPAAAAS